MSRLQELRDLVAASFKEVNTKELIEAGAKITAKLTEAEAEQNDLMAKNQELLDAYKDVILHTSVKASPKGSEVVAQTTKSFEEMLSDFMEDKNNG